MRLFLALAVALVWAPLAPAADLPLTGISHVNFRVSDLEKARGFYTGVLGFEEAFNTPNRNGGIGTVYLKVNDEQYIELSPGLLPDPNVRLTHISFVTTDIEKLHAMLAERGLNPTPLRPAGGDGTRGIRVADPFGFPLEFTQYLPDSMHAKARGKFESPKRVSTHLMHAGIMIPRDKLEEAMTFYRDKMGFVETWRGGRTDDRIDYVNLRTPGTRGDYIELMLHDPSPTPQQLFSMQHACLEVSDIQPAYKTVVDRGAPAESAKPKVGRNKKWQLNLFDPDGTRTELMEPKPR